MVWGSSLERDENGEVRSTRERSEDSGVDDMPPAGGAVAQRTMGPSFGGLVAGEKEGGLGHGMGSFTAVNRPANENQDDEEVFVRGINSIERVIQMGRASAAANRVYAGDANVQSRSGANGIQSLRKRDLDTMLHSQSPRLGYTSNRRRLRELSRYEEYDTPRFEMKSQWEKLLEAIRGSPELSDGQKKTLVFDLFSEHIKASARGTPSENNTGQDTSLSPTPFISSPKMNSVAIGDSTDPERSRGEQKREQEETDMAGPLIGSNISQTTEPADAEELPAPC
jgi:hypothetical protein